MIRALKKRILFVDDDPGVLDGLRRMLHPQMTEWDMTFVSCPKEASQSLKKEPFDAAVLDVKMAGKNGFVLLTEVKGNPKNRDIEVILMTGLQDESLKRQALNFGAADLLNKPIQTDDLIARLRSVLRMKADKDLLREEKMTLEKKLMESQHRFKSTDGG